VNEGQIEKLLRSADRAAGEPRFRPVTAAQVRRRLQRRWVVRLAVPAAAAAVVAVMVAVGVLGTQAGRPQPQPQPQQRIASLEAQVKQLQAQTDATLRLVREVLEKDRQERHLASLQAELARIPDPAQEIERQVDKTAFILVYQADRLYQELNQTESAVRAYKEVIQLFPTNQWADVARERLSQIEHRRINQSERKTGDAPCEPRNV
jgi:TolA-binding protein